MRVPRLTLKLLSLLLLPPVAVAQSFLQPKVVPTGNWPVAVYAQDINADGFPDLIYIDAGASPVASTTHVLLNDGHGNFAQSATIATAGNSIAFGNFTGSGRVDIGWFTPDIFGPGNAFLRSHVAANAGNGTFASPVSMLIETIPDTFQAGYTTGAHLFATGNDAFIVEDVHNNIVYAVQLYTPTSLPQGALLPLPDGPGPITVADFNGDGKLDFVVNGLTGSGPNPLPSAQVYLNQGPPGFAPFYTPPLRSTGLTGVRSLILQDVNLDGRLDLIAEGANGHIDVFAGNGDGTFASTSSGGTGPLDGRTGNGGHLIAVADLNHDNLPDAITITPAGVSTLLGQGTAYLGLKGIFNAGPTGQSGHPSYVTADFNHDGSLDLAVDSPEGIAILFGSPDGTFQTSLAYAAGQPALSSATGIFTASGHLDAVVSTAATQAQLLRGQGDGTFLADPAPTTSQTGPSGLWSTVITGDFDNDGNLDLALTADGPASALPKTPDGVQVQLGDGSGHFSPPQPLAYSVPPSLNCPQSPGYFYGTSIYYKTVADSFINRDFEGVHLVLNGNHHLPSPTYNTFDIRGLTTCGPYSHNLIAADFFTPRPASRIDPDVFLEGDGHLLLFTFANGPIVIYGAPLGDLAVDGSLTTPGQLTAPILFSLYGGYVGTSSGGLGFPAVLGSLTAADLDRDGNTDLIAVYNNFSADPKAPSPANPSYVYTWFGDGTGHFPVSPRHPVNPVRFAPSRNFYQAAVADLNGDGIPDLILTDGYILSVQLGLGDGSFGPETHFLAGQGINSLSVADTRGTGHTDLLIANGGAYLSNPAANRDLPQSNPDVNTGGITVLLNATPNATPPAPPATPVTLTGALTATPEPSTFGNAFILIATLTPPSSTSPTVTGTVTFSLDGTVFATTTVNPNASPSAFYSAPNTLAVGPHTVTAVYSGDSNYAPLTLTGTHTVTSAATTNSIYASPEPSTYGSAFTITATAGPGSYSFSVDGNTLGTVVSTTNTASIAGPATLAVGTHTIAASWIADGHALATIITGTHVVTIAPTSLSLLLCVDNPGSLFPCGTPLSATPPRNPITLYYGQTLDGVATESSTNLTGTITFLDNATPFCTINANLSGGATNMCPNASGVFHAGSRTVTAHYSGDTNNSPSTSNAIAVQVFPDITSSTLTSSINPAVVGIPVTFTVRVSGNFATPVGSVTFFDGLTPIGTGTLDSTGQATLTTSSLTVGTHPIAVAYAGSPDFNPAATVLLSQVINAATPALSPTVVTLVATGPTTLYFNQPALSAYSVRVLQPSTHPATGTLTVQDNGVDVAICTGIPNGSSCPYAGGGTLTVGTHSITVLYNGDSFNAPASSPPVVFTVLPDTTTATLSSSSNPAVLGTSVTFTATLAGNGGTLGATPPGSVNFLDGSTLLATATLSSSGIATFTTSSLALGTHPITVVYAGSTNFLPATSAALNQVITTAAPPPPVNPSFTLTVTPNPITIAVGRAGVLLVTVTETGAFAQPVALTCSGLTAQASCDFIQPLIPAGGGTTTLYLSTAAPHNCGDPTHPYFIGARTFFLNGRSLTRAAAALFPSAILLLVGLRRSRRRLTRHALTLLLCSLGFVLFTALSGCGACTDLGTRPGHYTLTVTATPQGGSLQPASQPVNFTVILP